MIKIGIFKKKKYSRWTKYSPKTRKIDGKKYNNVGFGCGRKDEAQRYANTMRKEKNLNVRVVKETTPRGTNIYQLYSRKKKKRSWLN